MFGVFKRKPALEAVPASVVVRPVRQQRVERAKQRYLRCLEAAAHTEDPARKEKLRVAANRHKAALVAAGVDV